MRSNTNSYWKLVAVFTLAAGAGPLWAQHHDTAQPGHQDKTAAKAGQRTGDPYPFDTCPTSGKKLGSMGDPVVKSYDGREVRFCCPGCPPQFEKDQPGNLAKLDEKMIKDQGPLYPLKTSVVTGKDLPAKPYEYVYGNRLIRVGAESEKAEFLKDPAKYMAALDKAVIDQQGTHYVLAKCPVSGEEFGGDMGKPVDVVVAGRLVRLCCKSCKPEVEKDPAKFVGVVDKARTGHDDKHDPGHKDKAKHDDHKHGG